MTEASSIRVGLVGFGAWGKRLLEKCETLPGVTVVGVADSGFGDSNVLLRGETRFYSSLERLLSAESVDAVVVAVSPSQQGRVVFEAVARGIPTFAEKPMAMDVEGARSIAKIAAERRVVVCVGHVVRYEPSFDVVLEWIAKDRIGEIRSIVGERVGARARPDADPLWILGPHEFSRIFALASGPLRFLSARVNACEATATFLVGSVSCEVHVGQGPPKRRRLEIVGTRGRIVLDESLGRASLENQDGVEIFEEKGDPLTRELSAFFAAIRHGKPLVTDADEGLRVVSALEAFESFAARSRSSSSAQALARVE